MKVVKKTYIIVLKSDNTNIKQKLVRIDKGKDNNTLMKRTIHQKAIAMAIFMHRIKFYRIRTNGYG